MVSPEVEIRGARELAIRYADAPALVASTLHPVMRKITGRLHAYLVRRKLSGEPLQSRTGNLRRAVYSRVELVGRTLLGRVGIDRLKAVYGRVHEFGGVIRPTRAKFLTIPVGRALTPSGVPRFTAREFIDATRGSGGGLYGFTGSFVNKNKTAIMGVRKSGDVEAVFALKSQVIIPARRPLSETLDENRDAIRQAFDTGIVDAVKRL